MIDIDTLAEDFYDELESIEGVNTETLQILAEHTLYNIKSSDLKFPRLIHGLIAYNESDYDYKEDIGYDEENDKVVSEITIIPRVVYRFKIYADSDTSDGLYYIINKIHDYYSNRYINHLNGDIQIVNTSQIEPLMIDVNDQATVGWSFIIDFDTKTTYTVNTDYAKEVSIPEYNINS